MCYNYQKDISGGQVLNTAKNMIIDNQLNKIITPDIDACTYNRETHRYDVRFKTGKTYPYSYNRISWLKDPLVLDPASYHITHLEKELFNIKAIYVFSNHYQKYWHICFENGSERDYPECDLKIVKSCLDNAASKSIFEYLKQIASLVSLKAEDGTKLLSKQYEKINSFIGEDTALAAYLNPKSYKNACRGNFTPIFPFGCNASQFKAVKAALENQISVIQGPPGTGKTQTILNIIANLLITGKTVQVVSNNNSATANVLEKLASSKYGMNFLVAPLGSSNNKSDFLEQQTGVYPNLSDWNQGIPEKEQFIEHVQNCSRKLNNIFVKQEHLALAKNELQELKVEQKHFIQYAEETTDNLTQYKIRKKLKSKQLMQLWQECQAFSDADKKITFFFKIKSCIIYGISDWDFYKIEISKIINMFQSLYYQTKAEELSIEIENLEHELRAQNAQSLIEEFTNLSMKYLKSVLYSKYGEKASRRVFSEDDLWKNPKEIQKEYPIILSTTFSSRSSLCKDASYDYVIMDEASQVDVATGALALSSAKNAVIVGDVKQLPNVVTENIEKLSNAIFESYKISDGYRFKRSFLQSVCELLPTAPQTLLREHYRCHPKIINFCNQKFYGGELVIMTSDNGEDDVLSVVKTVTGNHERNHMNQRQIDSIKSEILPKLQYPPSAIGIIAPYNNQVNAINAELSGTGVDVATVHKFQGREKDAIVLTTVDDDVTDFSDDPYLLNVAISRAKKQLCLVVSGNEQPTDSNIFDLVSYIEYNNFSVVESKIYSVFDYLYQQYTQSRMEFLKKHKRISEYDSENLMYALIKDTLQERELTFLDVICHLPLNMLIRNPNLLNDEECRYVMNPATHLDFLIYNCISKKPVLAIEVDGFHFHKEGTRQAERDKIKNRILELYEIPYLRFATNGSGEKERLSEKLQELFNK